MVYSGCRAQKLDRIVPLFPYDFIRSHDFDAPSDPGELPGAAHGVPSANQSSSEPQGRLLILKAKEIRFAAVPPFRHALPAAEQVRTSFHVR